MKKLLITLLVAASAAFAQKARVQRTLVCTGGGTASAATCTPSPALSALSDLSTTPRTLIHFTPTAASTGALTLAISGLAATSVVKYVGGAAQAIAADDLRASTSYLLEYDGTNFVVKSLLGNAGPGGSAITYGTCSLFSGCASVYNDKRAALHSTMSAGAVALIQVGFTGTVSLGKYVFGTNGGGIAGDGFSCAIYEDSSDAPGSRVAHFVTSGYSAFAIKTGTWASGTTLAPGNYWVGCSSESATSQFYGVDGGLYLPNAYLLAGISPNPRAVSCSNTAGGGSGTSYAMPSTCGTPSALTQNVAIFWPTIYATR